MSQLQFGLPGVGTKLSNSENEILWGGDDSRIEVLRLSKEYSSAARDLGATPTTVLRAGLLMGQITATRLLKEWDVASTDGSQVLFGILNVELQMTDLYGTAANKLSPCVVKAPVKAAALRILGAAFVGHANEAAARIALAQMGFRLDDDPQGYGIGAVSRTETKITDYTVIAADNGTLFVATTANATFTLPTIAAGLSFEFLRASDHNLVVASAAGDDMIVGNDLSADSVTWSTASNKIGARMRIRSISIAGTLKWLPEVVATPFSTGAFLTQTLAT